MLGVGREETEAEEPDEIRLLSTHEAIRERAPMWIGEPHAYGVFTTIANLLESLAEHGAKKIGVTIGERGYFLIECDWNLSRRTFEQSLRQTPLAVVRALSNRLTIEGPFGGYEFMQGEMISQRESQRQEMRVECWLDPNIFQTLSLPDAAWRALSMRLSAFRGTLVSVKTSTTEIPGAHRSVLDVFSQAFALQTPLTNPITVEINRGVSATLALSFHAGRYPVAHLLYGTTLVPDGGTPIDGTLQAIRELGQTFAARRKRKPPALGVLLLLQMDSWPEAVFAGSLKSKIVNSELHDLFRTSVTDALHSRTKELFEPVCLI